MPCLGLSVALGEWKSRREASFNFPGRRKRLEPRVCLSAPGDNMRYPGQQLSKALPYPTLPSFYRNFGQAPNLNWKDDHQRPGVRCFVAEQFFSPFIQNSKWQYDKGEKGGLDTPQKWWRYLWTAPNQRQKSTYFPDGKFQSTKTFQTKCIKEKH